MVSFPSLSLLTIRPARIVTAVAALALAALLPGIANAQATFRNIADTTTTAPNGATYTSFGNSFSVSGNNVAFNANYNGGSGIFLNNGTSTITIAATGQATPNGTTYTSFGDSSLSGSNVAFVGSYSGGSGIFLNNGTSTSTITRTGQTTPNGSTYSGFGAPSLSGSNVAFYGAYDNYNSSSIFLNNGTSTSTIARTGQASPNGTTYSGFSSVPSVSGSNVTFQANYNNGNSTSIFLNNGTSTSTIATIGQATPSGGTFNYFGNYRVSGSNVAFFSIYNNYSKYGIFLNNGTSTTLVVATGQATPNGGTFSNFSPASLSGSNVVFAGAYDGGSSAIFSFSSTTNSLTSIIKTGDSLFGSTVSTLNFGASSLDGNNMAFQYTLANGRGGIAYATLGAAVVPESSTLALALPALGMVATILARRKKK